MTGMDRKPVCLLIRNCPVNFATEFEKGMNFFFKNGSSISWSQQHSTPRNKNTVCKKAFGHFVFYALVSDCVTAIMHYQLLIQIVLSPNL
jgi:hypothetical protein